MLDAELPHFYAENAEQKRIPKLRLKHEPPKSLTRNYDLTEVDKRYERNWTQIMYASYTGNIEKARELIDNKANLNLRNDKGLTALMLAFGGYTDLVKLLKQWRKPAHTR